MGRELFSKKEMREKKIMVIIILFFLGLILMVGVYFMLDKRSSKKEETKLQEEQTEKKERKKNQSDLWEHKLSYKGRDVTLPCKYSEFEKVFPVKNFNRVRGVITLSDGSELYPITAYMGVTEDIPSGNLDFDIYGFLMSGKNLSVGGVRCGMSQKKVMKLLGKPHEGKNDEWIYVDPKKSDADGAYFALMFRNKKVYSMELYNDGAAETVIE